MANDLISTSVAGLPAWKTVGQTNRPTILFVHGAFVTHASWQGWMQRLARHGWPGVAVSRRGRLGVAPDGAKGLRFADYLDDTLRAVDAVTAESGPPIVVGHSLGGLLAQKVAEVGRCRAMVLLAPAPAAMLTAQAAALPAYLPMFPKILAGRPLLPSPAGTARIAFNGMPPAERARLRATLVPESGIVYRELIFGAVKLDASKVQCPAIVVGGAHDRIVSEALLRLTARQCHADLRVLPDHAHWLLEEPGWEAIADQVSTWLEQRTITATSAPAIVNASRASI